MFKRLIASLICLTFSFSNLQYVHAQDFSINQLPVPGTMVGESVPFSPLALKGLVVNLNKPLEFQFIVDTGRGPQDSTSVKDQANQLVKYFLAGLTIPEGDLWVNLSPYEKNRMVPEALGQTDLGRDLLAQDYILKQLTASLIYPEKDLGKAFWSRVYAKAQEQFGTTNIPVNTFNKVWILPNQAQVFENGNAAYVTKSTLKVMLDEDYLAKQKHSLEYTKSKQLGLLGANIVRQIILPEIEKEVNTGKNFAPLRQIYQALILAKWYKETIQNGLLDAVYTNKNKIAGVNLDNPAVKEQIYNRYLQAYKKGAFNYIKEDPTPDGQVVPRKYFSGGLIWRMTIDPTGRQSDIKGPDGAMISLTVGLVAAGVGISALFYALDNKAIIQIAAWRRKGKVGEIAMMLSNENYKVVRVAEKALAQLGASKDQMVNGYLEALSETHLYKRTTIINAINKLSELGDKRAIGPIFRILSYSKHDDTHKAIYLSAARAILKLGGYEHEDILKKFIERQPTESRISIFKNLERAISYKQEGYDFKIVWRPAVMGKKGDWDRNPIYGEIEPEFLGIERGEKLSDRAMSQTPPKQTPDAAMFAKTRIAFWTRTGNVDKIANMLSYNSGYGYHYYDKDVHQAARKALDKLATDSESQYRVGLAGIKRSDSDILIWATEMLVKSGKKEAIVPIAERVVSLGFLHLVHHSIFNFYKQAREVLGKLATDPESQYQVGFILLESKDIDIVKWATEMLVKSGKKEAIRVIAEKLHTEVWGYYTVALEAWERLGADREFLFQESLKAAAIYTDAIEWLGNSGDKRAVPLLRKLLETTLAEPAENQGYLLNKLSDALFALGDEKGKIKYKYVPASGYVVTKPETGHYEEFEHESWEYGKLGTYYKGWVVEPEEGYWTTPAHLEEIPRDEAMLNQIVPLVNHLPENGGIDLNQINVNRTGKTVNVQFDPAQLNQLMQGGFEGFTPVITSMTHISSPFQLLGINPAKP